MEKLNFLEFYSVVVGMIWLFLIVATSILTNKSRLLQKGYKTEYIDYTRKDVFKRNIGIAFGMPLLGGIAAVIIWFFVDDINEFQNMIYVALLWIVLVIPFPILDIRNTNKKYKELAVKTDSDIFIDFNFSILHLIFKPILELVTSILVIIYFISFLEPFHIVFIHLLILWALYSVGRFSKFLVGPQIRDGYLYLCLFLMLNHGFIIFHLFRETLSKSDCSVCLSTVGFYLGTSLTALLLLKLFYYLYQIPTLIYKLKKQ